ncbi:hypothetical protein BZA05DRAFT_241044 [Tricharina praecox]|uniref:uncharacterized protein n=1 Tax=Tricharina praecox TaxID=43433 RepID=UPI00221F0ED8|nr:uncharacterized protein BZA05DRAFT_241044 [Tricharina praecox]KAI5855490.1 hypothetical protein BZA05DRAFT_241044 [Tricharina praecox]
MAVNLLHGRCRKLLDEPAARIKKALNGSQVSGGHIWVPLLYLQSIIRYWNNVLNSFNAELIVEERTLLQERTILQRNNNYAYTSDYSHIRDNHTATISLIAAHLYWYRSQLASLEDIVSDITARQKVSMVGLEAQSLKIVLEQVASNLKLATAFRDTLECKAQNILALLDREMQSDRDHQMQLYAMETQAREACRAAEASEESQVLARAMKEDSVAMKTVRIRIGVITPSSLYHVKDRC